MPIPSWLHEDVQDVTVLIHGAPQVLLATLDRDEHLVEMPGVSHPTAPAPQLEIPNGGGAWSPLVWSPGSVMTSDARVHIVQRGETLTQIAARYGRSVQALVAANDLRSPNRLQIGARLSIPGPAVK